MRLFNTLTRTVDDFSSRDPGRVAMYVCGPTVQARPHVGHGRFAVIFDVLRRYLEWRGYEVTYVQNVTDVDDKIIAAARDEGRKPQEVAADAASAFAEAFRKLGVRPPTIQPRATEHIPEMIEMIGSLVAGGHAYEAQGDVYFSVRTFPAYGKLSGRRIDELQAGARVEPGEHKRDPLDFAVWKAAKPGEPTWDSPWGPGRPGWHIECSAMARRYLGPGFDIHAGGSDLVFPHHENEIAQAEAATGQTFARWWMHNGMVNLAGEKMSKSTGHIVDLLTALDTYPPLAVRLFYLRTHYRKPLDFSAEALDDAAASLERLWAFRRRAEAAEATGPADGAIVDRFVQVVDSDFDVAGGLGVLFDAVRSGNRTLDDGGEVAGLAAAYDVIMGVLGLAEPRVDLSDVSAALERLAAAHAVDGTSPAELVEALLGKREAARAARDWGAADEVREALGALGIVVEDAAGGARWRRA